VFPLLPVTKLAGKILVNKTFTWMQGQIELCQTLIEHHLTWVFFLAHADLFTTTI